MHVFTVRTALTAGLVMASVGLSAGGGPAQSPKAASGLVTLMTSRGVSTIAATDPQTPGRIVAAMLIPGVQLLVIGAKSTAAAYLESQIAQGQYADAYAVLNSTAIPESRM